MTDNSNKSNHSKRDCDINVAVNEKPERSGDISMIT